MNDEARWLVDHDQVRVFVDHSEIDRFGGEIVDNLWRRGLHHRPDVDPVAGPGRRPIESDACVEERPCLGPAQIEEIGQHLVDPLARQALGHR
jgi:hypothetical protein